MTIKASSVLSIAAIWAAMVPAIVDEPEAWWSLIFAGLATLSIGLGAWRRLGMSRLVAVAGIWVATAVGIAAEPDAAWMSVFAFLATAATTFSALRREAVLLGLAIAVAWGASGTAVATNGEEAAWTSIFAFLTAATLSNSRGNALRALWATAAWASAGAVMVATDGWHWLSVVAWLLSMVTPGFGGFELPRRFEWDLFDRDDDAGYVSTGRT